MSLPWQLSPTGLVVKVQAPASHVAEPPAGLARTAPQNRPERTAGRRCGQRAALIAFVAAQLDLPPHTVSLRSGATSRAKGVHIQTPTPARIGHRLQAWLARLDNKKRDD